MEYFAWDPAFLGAFSGDASGTPLSSELLKELRRHQRQHAALDNLHQARGISAPYLLSVVQSLHLHYPPPLCTVHLLLPLLLLLLLLLLHLMRGCGGRGERF